MGHSIHEELAEEINKSRVNCPSSSTWLAPIWTKADTLVKNMFEEIMTEVGEITVDPQGDNIRILRRWTHKGNL